MKYVAVDRDISHFQMLITNQQINDICCKAFGHGAAPLNSELITSGKFNTCYRIEIAGMDPVILRLAPASQAVLFKHEQYLLRRESNILNTIAKASSTIPKNIYIDFSRELIDRDYVFQHCLEGELWSEISTELSEKDNEQLWAQLGPVVKRIHSIPGELFGPPDPVQGYKSWSESVISWISGMIEDMQSFQLPSEDAEEFLSFVCEGSELLDEIKQPRLIHGDLWPKNILVDRCNGKPEITAILDAERAIWGDPSAEWIFTFLDIPDSFWRGYGTLKNDEGAKFRRRVYEGRGAIQLCLEAWRFRFDDTFARNILSRAKAELMM